MSKLSANILLFLFATTNQKPLEIRVLMRVFFFFFCDESLNMELTMSKRTVECHVVHSRRGATTTSF